MSIRVKTVTALVGAGTIALLLTSCYGAGAQNGNPVGKGPAGDDPAETVQCAVAAKEAVDAIDAAVGGHDDTDYASIRKGDGGWYLGASITPNQKDDPNEDEVTVWATTSDPTSEEFDGTVYPVNEAAKTAVADESTDATAAPSGFSADADAAQAVAQCVIASTDH
ncbi:MAG: hypothetical protein ACTHMH_01740 [Curtobacterium sp.]